ncbi:hypothetical protein D3C72_1247780 [compost metagenome]
MTCHRIGPRFAGLLIDAMVCVGRQTAALPGFKIHHVIAQSAAVKAQCRLLRFRQQRQIDAEPLIGRFGTRDRLEHQIHRDATLHQPQRIGHMGQHAGLRRNGEALDHVVQHVVELFQQRQAVAGRVDADDRIPATIQQAVEHAGGDALQTVGRMIRLQPHAESPRQAEGIAKTRDDPALLRHQDQILIAHQFTHCRRHFRRNACSYPCQHRAVRLLAQEPIAEIPHRKVRYRRKGQRIVAIDNQPCDLVMFIRHQQLLEKGFQRHIRQRDARRHAFFCTVRRHLRQIIAGTCRRCLGQQLA